MSGAYLGDGRRKSSMTHATRGHKCSVCGRTVFGNGGEVSHGRGHVRRGEAVELVKHYPNGENARAFVPVNDTDTIEAWVARGGYVVPSPEEPPPLPTLPAPDETQAAQVHYAGPFRTTSCGLDAAQVRTGRLLPSHSGPDVDCPDCLRARQERIDRAHAEREGRR